MREVDRASLQLDFSAQLVTSPSTERSAQRELAFSRFEPYLSRVPRLRKRAALLVEKPTAHLLLLG